ncbi:MAG: hypothetical protein V4661_07830 [Pseudomonadota bacterium]
MQRRSVCVCRIPDFTGKLSESDVVKITAFIQGTADAVRPNK